MRKLVVDLSVWIDLYHGGVLESFLSANYDILVSDAQLLENEAEKGLCLGGLLLRFSAESYTSSEMAEAFKLGEMHRGVKMEDILAFLLARRTGAILVTGDKSLRKLAESSGVECHGIIWILDELVATGTITRKQGYDSLQLIMRENARLPKDEVEKRLKSWRS